MFDWVDIAGSKLASMSPVGTDLETVKQQTEEMKVRNVTFSFKSSCKGWYLGSCCSYFVLYKLNSYLSCEYGIKWNSFFWQKIIVRGIFNTRLFLLAASFP